MPRCCVTARVVARAFESLDGWGVCVWCVHVLTAFESLDGCGVCDCLCVLVCTCVCLWLLVCVPVFYINATRRFVESKNRSHAIFYTLFFDFSTWRDSMIYLLFCLLACYYLFAEPMMHTLTSQETKSLVKVLGEATKDTEWLVRVGAGYFATAFKFKRNNGTTLTLTLTLTLNPIHSCCVQFWRQESPEQKKDKST